jgi:hypothetical protein
MKVLVCEACGEEIYAIQDIEKDKVIHLVDINEVELIQVDGTKKTGHIPHHITCSSPRNFIKHYCLITQYKGTKYHDRR